jgi:hypothetical protein
MRNFTISVTPALLGRQILLKFHGFARDDKFHNEFHEILAWGWAKPNR